MAATDIKDDRRVIPRWRDSRATAQGGELAPLKRRAAEPADDARELVEWKVREWEENRSLPFAADLAATAFVTGEYEEARAAADFILSGEHKISDSLRTLVLRILGLGESVAESPPGVARKAGAALGALRPVVHSIREHLREDPRNVLVWVDLALAYTILGQPRPANNAMETALRISPTNRFVLRSAVRLAVHLDEPDRAHDLLVRAPATALDPWLIAAEIATSSVADRQPHFVKVARRLLESGLFPAFDLSELRSALGTMELHAGAEKRARKLFRASLVDPTENAIAQGRWAAVKLHAFDETLAPFLGRSAEARAWTYMHDGDWLMAIQESWSWLKVEPFSKRPCVHGSYVASVALDDHARAAALARVGLEANPDDFNLKNNLVFALASQGQVIPARENFDSIEQSKLGDADLIPWRATLGLLEFRSGRPTEGRQHYLAAITAARHLGAADLEKLAWLFLAREELLAGSRTSTETLHEALNASKGTEAGQPKVMEAVRQRILALSKTPYLA